MLTMYGEGARHLEFAAAHWFKCGGCTEVRSTNQSAILQHQAPPLKSLNSHTFLRGSLELRESIFPWECQ